MKPNDASGTISDLQNLIGICADGIAGYRRAADIVEDPELRAALLHGASEREEVSSVFTYALIALGAKSDHHGSVPGAVHRAILVALGAAHARDRAVLRECERGERATFHAMEEVLSHPLSNELHSLVQSQYGRLLQASEALGRLARVADERASGSRMKNSSETTAGALERR